MRFNEIMKKERVIKLFQKVSVSVLVCMLIAARAERIGIEKGMQISEEKHLAELAEIEAEEQKKIAQAEARTGIVSEAEACAKVLYGTARNNVPADQKAVVWCIINRCESAYYPDTIREVCSQDKQWMGYSDGNPIIKELYELAKGELEIWHNGGYRPITSDFIYMSWSESEVTLRTSFIDSKSTRYWTPER